MQKETTETTPTAEKRETCQLFGSANQMSPSQFTLSGMQAEDVTIHWNPILFQFYPRHPCQHDSLGQANLKNCCPT
ncbi:hypothetical protein MLD38_003054 [Melastoma candidum]|uniref:Uncharacterized protein n=1 Tax=Melastoma candidum TaxID=119954 RepID=A0ACB9S0T9_9MYRT|nr:hypothetical protein MLD38_003054 [Melastoma candidum]